MSSVYLDEKGNVVIIKVSGRENSEKARVYKGRSRFPDTFVPTEEIKTPTRTTLCQFLKYSPWVPKGSCHLF